MTGTFLRDLYAGRSRNASTNTHNTKNLLSSHSHQHVKTLLTSPVRHSTLDALVFEKRPLDRRSTMHANRLLFEEPFTVTRFAGQMARKMTGESSGVTRFSRSSPSIPSALLTLWHPTELFCSKSLPTNHQMLEAPHRISHPRMPGDDVDDETPAIGHPCAICCSWCWRPIMLSAGQK